MKSAFGIALDRGDSGLSGSVCYGEVCFWEEAQGWCCSLQVAGINISETMGAASPEACYRSLRGRAKNLMRGLAKLGVRP